MSLMTDHSLFAIISHNCICPKPAILKSLLFSHATVQILLFWRVERQLGYKSSLAGLILE